MKIQEINGDTSGPSYEEELSAEDIQMFELENAQLYNELNTVTEEIKQIESKVVHIAELQEVFTEKVLDQDKDLDKLMTTVVGSTENVKEANEQIRQAIQRNAGLRVWALFFLLVMSFSLLFLDWYNPWMAIFDYSKFFFSRYHYTVFFFGNIDFFKYLYALIVDINF